MSAGANSASERVSTCVWTVTADLLLALDARFGEPVDTYVNGSQVWLRDDGPNGEPLEWRLHPVAGYKRPKGPAAHEVFETIVFALRAGEEPLASPESLWEGLEAFPCYGDEIEPAPLAAAVTEAIGTAPTAFGVVDHEPIALAWEHSEGRVSIVAALLAQLSI